MVMGEDERYRFRVLDPLREAVSAEIWDEFARGELELNWYDLDSFELLRGKEVVGEMSGGVWNES